MTSNGDQRGTATPREQIEVSEQRRVTCVAAGLAEVVGRSLPRGAPDESPKQALQTAPTPNS